MRKPMVKDRLGHSMQAFVADPAKSVVPTAITTTLSLKTLVGFDDAVALLIRSDAAITRYFNTDATKTRTIAADTDTIIVLDDTVTDIVLTGTATVEIEAM
jgi:hypothetical protein